MSTQNNLKPTLYWTKLFFENEELAQLRFKRFVGGMPPFDFPEGIIDEVSEEEFYNTEDERVPLFIGSQFGIYPRFDKVLNLFKSPTKIAILGKSLLSGCVSGLSIYDFNNGAFIG